MIRLALTRPFIRDYERLSKQDQYWCDKALQALPEMFGNPHRHAGLGIRALRRGLYECRSSQSIRIGFTRQGDTLLVRTVGTHNTIRSWLRNNL